MVRDELIPGTMNIGVTLAAVAEAYIYLTVDVEPITLGALIAAAAVYYLFLLSNGTFQLFAPEMLDKAFDNMLVHLLRGEVTVTLYWRSLRALSRLSGGELPATRICGGGITVSAVSACALSATIEAGGRSCAPITYAPGSSIR